MVIVRLRDFGYSAKRNPGRSWHVKGFSEFFRLQCIHQYEALVLMAFLALLLAYIGASTDEQMAVMQDKGKRGLPFPFGVSPE